MSSEFKPFEKLDRYSKRIHKRVYIDLFTHFYNEKPEDEHKFFSKFIPDFIANDYTWKNVISKIIMPINSNTRTTDVEIGDVEFEIRKSAAKEIDAFLIMVPINMNITSFIL